MTEPPPPRYRVIEEGRRLVVIDRWETGGRPRPVSPTDPIATPAMLGGIRQTRFDGSAELNTHPLYDDKGPRTIRLDPNSATLTKVARYALLAVAVAILIAVIFSPWLLVPAAFIAFKSHGKARAAITRWLDTIGREAG